MKSRRRMCETVFARRATAATDICLLNPFSGSRSWDTWEALRTLAREPFERPPRALTTPEHKQPLTYSTAMSVSRRLISTLEIGMHCARSS